LTKSKGINIEKIAQMIGVHPSTVSRALNGSLRVKQATRERIEIVAQETGYIRDNVAKSLIEGKTYTLGILVPEISNSFYSRIVDEIENKVGKSGYGIILAATNFLYSSESKALKAMLSKRVDALIICMPSDQILNDYRDLQVKVPVVVCDTIRDNIPYNNVYVDDKRGILKAVQYLASLGHKEIGFIAEQNITQHRLNDFVQAMKKCGLELNHAYLRVEPEITAECGYLGMKRLLQYGRLPTAVLCARDTIAIGTMRAAVENGLSIPKDISIIGYDDISIAKYLYPALTTVRQPVEEVGSNVGNLVLRKINEKTGTSGISRIVLTPDLIVRESAAVPRRRWPR
jgi:DNA-binding LacI/PurR family transcriptional regulator